MKTYLIGFSIARNNTRTESGRVVRRCKISPDTLRHLEEEIKDYLNVEFEKILASHGEVFEEPDRVLSVKILHFTEMESD